MKEIINWLEKLNFFIGAFAFLLMSAVIFLQVIARYMFNHALPWPEELGRYLFLICAWASICFCIEKKEHLRVDIIPIFFPAFNKILGFISIIATFIFFGISSYLVYQMMMRVMKMGTHALTMPLPMWLIWLAILLFCLLSLLLSIKNFLVAIYSVGTKT